MRALIAFSLLFVAGCSNTGRLDEAFARRVCTSEGMWCQDENHSRCCRGLRCDDGKCVRRDSKSRLGCTPDAVE